MTKIIENGNIVIEGANSDALDLLEGKEEVVVVEEVVIVEESTEPAKLSIKDNYRLDIESTDEALRFVTDRTRYVETDNDMVLDLLAVPSIGIVGIQEAGAKLDSYTDEEIDELGINPHHATEAIANAFLNIEKSGVDEEALARPGSDWRQDIDGRTTKITEIKVKDRELTGEAALFSAMSSLGLGVPLDAILPHSGFWVRLTPPTDTEIISFRRRLARTKTELGRKTSGLTFGNQSALINKELFNFIRRHITESSVAGFTLAQIHNRIKAEDLRILAWQFARTFFSEGFLFAHDCMNFASGCTNREEVLASIDKLLEFDIAKLTDRQREIIGITMATPMTEELYVEFHNEWTWNKDNVLEFNDKDSPNYMRITLQSPTAEEHFADGTDWVNQVSLHVNRALTEGDFEENSDAHLMRIDQYLTATNMRNYSHYVKEIEVRNGIRYVDRTAIRNVLGAISGKPRVVEAFEEGIAEWRQKLVVAVVGIPEYECPKCKEINKFDVEQPVKKVIPLDVMGVFFLMLSTKYQMSSI